MPFSQPRRPLRISRHESTILPADRSPVLACLLKLASSLHHPASLTTSEPDIISSLYQTWHAHIFCSQTLGHEKRAMFENVRSIPLEHLADYVRAEYRTAFAQDVAEGRSLQLTVPYVILGAFIAPMLWLAIPQLHSPWMRFMRWLVVAFIMAFNLHVIWDVSSGTSFGAAYVIGLTAAWGMISTANFLVWNHAHRDAARIVKRVKEKKTSQIQSGHGLNGSMDQIHLRRRNIDGTASPPKSNGTTRESSEIEYEYIWEPFPEAGTFSERFLWSFDLMTDLRFVGKEARTRTLVGCRTVY